MFLVNQALTDLELGTGALIAVLGYAVVFVGLIALMAVVTIMGKIMVANKKKAAAPAAAPAPAPAPAAQPVLAAAAGSAGNIKLYNVSDRDAAILMAIVADKMGKPLNTLRFKSMKEVH